MAIRNIIQVGDPTLRKKSFEVTDFGEKTQTLIDDMKQTLIKAEGAGLRYRFIPSPELETLLKTAIKTNTSPILTKLDKNLQEKI